MNQNTPDFVGSTLYDLDGGILAQKINAAVAETAFAVAHGDDKRKKGRITIELTLELMSDDSRMLQVSHKLMNSRPTKRGKVTTEDETSTPLYCNHHGKLTLAPDTQLDFIQQQSRHTQKETV